MGVFMFNLDDIDVVQGTCKVPYETDYLNGSKANSTITFKEYVLEIDILMLLFFIL